MRSEPSAMKYQESETCAERTARLDLNKLTEWNAVEAIKEGKITRYLLLPAFRYFPF